MDGQIEREVVLIEWKDREPANTTFEGTARELLRLQQPMPIHPLGEMTFNPAARPGDADWRVMYLGAGDSRLGRAARQPPPEPAAARHPRRQDPPHRPRPARAHEHEHRQRERPLPDPQRQPVHHGRRRAQGDLGVRPAQSASADLGRGPGAGPRTPTLLAFNIGLVTWETVLVIHKGANYGYPLREGTQSMSSTNGMGPIPDDDMIPIQISDTVTRGTVKPTYPVIQYPHNREQAATPSPTVSSTAAS